MKKFVGIAIGVVTLACATAVIAPASSAFAAQKLVLKDGSNIPSTVYADKSYYLKVIGTDAEARFYSSNTSIATITSNNGKLTPKAPGKVRITAKNKETGKALAVKTVKVLQRAKRIKLSRSEVYLKASEAGTAATTTLSATLEPSTSTDSICFTSSDKSVATVGATSGKITAVGPGTCTITAYAKRTKETSNNSAGNKVAETTVYVGPQLVSVENDADLVFAKFDTLSAPDVVSASDFRLTHPRSTERDTAIKSAKIEGDTVTLESSEQLYYGEVYKLTYGKKTVEFTAAEPKVASIRLTSLPVIGVATPISVQFLSPKGNVLNELKLGSRNDSYYGYDAQGTAFGGDCYNDKVLLWNAGSRLTVTVRVYRFKYDENGKLPVVFSDSLTVAPRDPEPGEVPEDKKPTYDVRSVSYNHSGGVGGTIRISLSDSVSSWFSVGDFTVKLKTTGVAGRAEYVPDSVSVSGADIVLSITSSDLTNGKTYEVYCAKEPLAKKLGEFTVVKYTYTPPSSSGGDDEPVVGPVPDDEPVVGA